MTPPKAIPGVVYDCMIYLQAAVSQAEPTHAALSHAQRGSVRLHVSQELLNEVRDVLTRPKTQRKFPHLTEARVRHLIEDVTKTAHVEADVPGRFEYPRDPKDEKYVNLALAAGARYLVSWDKDLLDLMKDETFRARFPELTVLDPVAFLRVLLDEGNDADEG